MDTITLTIRKGGNETVAQAEPGKSLLWALRAAGFSIRALCGERGICGSCKVRITKGEIPAGEEDAAYFTKEELQEGWRLACKAYPEADVTVEAPEAGEDDIASVIHFHQIEADRETLTIETMELAKSKDSISLQITGGSGAMGLPQLQAAGRLAADPGKAFCVTRYGGRIVRIGDGQERLYAIGVDIGTTTLGFALVDLQTTTVAGRLSMVNRQREYGADVVTRIVKARSGDLDLLSGTIRGQIGEGAARLCGEYGIDPGSVVKLAIAGNTTMLHLLLGLRCDMLGSFPFTPVTLDQVSAPYRELFEGAFSCEVDVLPGISTYVGADITAGLLCLMLHKSDKPGILLDIGTNGEMALAAEGRILCTSTAAGPALEGVNIAWGTGSVPGAISSIRYGSSGFTVSTIGNQPPVGICGSGVIDCVYQFLKHGVIDETGRLQGEWAATGAVIARTAQGEDIFLSQKDVREVQLAKSAIRSGIEILIRQARLSYSDIDTLYVAGGFGNNIDFASGVGIGLVPVELKDRIKVAGNSSLGGVVSYLINPGQKEAMDEIVRLSSEFSLAEDEAFEDMFIENMSFDRSVGDLLEK
ncbi:MAG: ASKHA domain-containing protein [Clostridiales bacterium]|nr:ASKHA domain-containing protein [Clostridiales bacterium]